MNENQSKILKEQIKERLKAQAKLHWPKNPNDRQDSALNYDPLVDLLFSAFASEMERIYDRIETVESRVMERTLGMIIPEGINKPLPAYSVVNILPRINELEIENNETLLELWSPNLKKAFHFTSSDTFKAINGKVKILAFSNAIYEYSTPMERKSLIMKAEKGSRLPDKQVWIGLQLPLNTDSFERICLYFNWKNHKNKEDFFRHLYEIQLFHQDEKIPFKIGIKDYISTNESNSSSSEWMRQYEKSVQQTLGKHFISIEPSQIVINAHKYPKEWENILSPEQLKPLTEPLVWLKIVFPSLFNEEIFENMIIAINCFPVLNRFIKGKEESRTINEYFNVFPLKLNEGEQFVDIHTVSNNNGEFLKRVEEIKSEDTHCFVLRTGGATRFDKRDALQNVNQLINLFRDEAFAFISVGEDNKNELFNQLKTILNILQNKIPQLLPTNYQEIRAYPYVCVQETEETRIEIQYWLTEGAEANKIEMNSSLSTSDPGIDTITLMQPVSGGRDPLSPTSQILSAKRALLTRNQIITHADLKVAILNEYESWISDVKIQKQTAQLAGQKRGIKPILMIKLCYSSANKPAKASMEDVRSGILRMIDVQSSIPINSLFDIDIQWVEN